MKRKYKIGDRVRVLSLCGEIGTITDIIDKKGIRNKNTIKFDNGFLTTCSYPDEELELLKEESEESFKNAKDQYESIGKGLSLIIQHMAEGLGIKSFQILKRRNDFFDILQGDELKEITFNLVDSNDEEKIDKMVDFYNQLICETHNFINEIKNETGV